MAMAIYIYGDGYQLTFIVGIIMEKLPILLIILIPLKWFTTLIMGRAELEQLHFIMHQVVLPLIMVMDVHMETVDG